MEKEEEIKIILRRLPQQAKAISFLYDKVEFESSYAAGYAYMMKKPYYSYTRALELFESAMGVFENLLKRLEELLYGTV